MIKKCISCHQEKDQQADFYHRYNGKYIRSKCKRCLIKEQGDFQKMKFSENPEKERIYRHEYYLKNKEKYYESHRKFMERHPGYQDKYKDYMKHYMKLYRKRKKIERQQTDGSV